MVAQNPIRNTPAAAPRTAVVRRGRPDQASRKRLNTIELIAIAPTIQTAKTIYPYRSASAILGEYMG